MPETFGSFLRAALVRKGIGVCEFARLAGYPKAHGFVSRVIAGKSLPPLKELDRWALPLGLTAKERRRFELLAGIANSPAVVREWFEQVDDAKNPTANAKAKRRP